MANKKGAHHRPRNRARRDHWTDYTADKGTAQVRHTLPAPTTVTAVVDRSLNRRKSLRTDHAQVGIPSVLVLAIPPTTQYSPYSVAGSMHISSYKPPPVGDDGAPAFCGSCGINASTATLVKCSCCNVYTCILCGDLCDICSADVCFKCMGAHLTACEAKFTGALGAGDPNVPPEPGDPTDPDQAVDFVEIPDNQVDWGQNHNLFI